MPSINRNEVKWNKLTLFSVLLPGGLLLTTSFSLGAASFLAGAGAAGFDSSTFFAGAAAGVGAAALGSSFFFDSTDFSAAASFSLGVEASFSAWGSDLAVSDVGAVFFLNN